MSAQHTTKQADSSTCLAHTSVKFWRLMLTVTNLKVQYDLPQIVGYFFINLFSPSIMHTTSSEKKEDNGFIPTSLNQGQLVFKLAKFCFLAWNSRRLPMTLLIPQIQFIETEISHLHLDILGGTLQWYKSLIFSPKPYLFKPIKN